MNSTSDHQKYTNIESVSPDYDNPVVTFYSDGSVCSRMLDVEWSFVATLMTGVGKENKVTFSNIDENHRFDIQKVVYKIHKQFPSSVSAIQMRINNLKLIASCIGSTEWTKLNQDNYYRQFKNNLKNRKYSITILDQVLACLRKLHDLGIISRYEKNTKYKFTKGLACSTKQVKKQHIAIPEGMSSQLFKVAMDIVDKYHPYRHEISAIHAKAIQAQIEVFAEADSKKKVSKRGLQWRVS